MTDFVRERNVIEQAVAVDDDVISRYPHRASQGLTFQITDNKYRDRERKGNGDGIPTCEVAGEKFARVAELLAEAAIKVEHRVWERPFERFHECIAVRADVDYVVTYGPGGGGATSSRRKVSVGRNGLRVLAPAWVAR